MPATERTLPESRVVPPALALVVDLDEAVPSIADSAHTCAVVLVRRDRRPVAEVVVPLGSGALTSVDLRAAIEAGIVDQRPNSAPPSPPEPVEAGAHALTVVVTTCGNPEELVRCVDSILDSSGSRPSVIVVDNRPGDPRTRQTVEARYGGEDRVTLIPEVRQGLSWARNAGISAADTPWVAWTDDDVVVDRYWARSLIEAFETTSGVGLVTGLVRPLELETEAQIWRELHRGYSNGFDRRIWRLSEPPENAPLFPYATGRIGTGANMAARRETLARLGAFDTDLGAGTPAAGGEDLDLIFRFLQAGSTVVYEPAAIVSHRHHADFEDLVDQARHYGIGLASYLMKLLSDRRRLGGIARRAPAAVSHLRTLRRGPRDRPATDPGIAHRMRRAETVGLITGVRRDLSRRARRLGRRVHLR